MAMPFDPSTRRIGDRIAIEPTPATVEVEVGRFRRRPGKAPVQIVNTSVSGVGFLTDRGSALPVGTITRIELEDGTSSEIQVRQSRELPDEAAVYHGALFIEPRPAVVPKLDVIAQLPDTAAKRARWEHLSR